MKQNSLVLFLILLTNNGFGQGRISADVSSRFQQGVNVTFNYHHLITDKLLLSAGVFMGGNGRSFNDIDTNALNDGKRLSSPYAEVNQPVIDSSGTYNLLAYRTMGSHFGIELGIGTYKALNENNAIRGHIYSKSGMASVLVNGYYRSTENYTTIEKNAAPSPYFFTSLSLEVYHVIKISPKMTFYWGVKVPYYFQVDKERFNTINYQDIHFGFEPEFTGGLTFYIGKPVETEKTED